MEAFHRGIKIRRWAVYMLILCVTLAGLPAAGLSQSTDALRIGFTAGNLENPYFVEFVGHIEAMCEELGIALSVYDGKNDVARQIAIIQQWTSEAYDAVICSPIDPTTLQTAISDCMQAGIPFINIDSECVSKTTFIGAEQFAYGYAAGKIAADWLNANIAEDMTIPCVILTKPQSLAIIERGNGIMNGLLENCDRARIVSTLRYMDRESAETEVRQVLTEIPDVLCIVGVADVSVLGAYDALTEQQRENPGLCLVGLDATAEMLEMIAAGTVIRGTVSQDLKVYAQTCVQAALDAIDGHPSDHIFMDITPVTIENVQDYI